MQTYVYSYIVICCKVCFTRILQDARGVLAVRVRVSKFFKGSFIFRGIDDLIDVIDVPFHELIDKPT